MSTAANRNFAAAQRERNRRVALSLDDPSFLAVTGDPAGDAFFGSLHDKADAARAAGMGFRADLSSIGRDDVPMQGGGRLTATDRAGIAGNIGLGQLTDANAIRQLTMNRLNSARQDEIVDSLRAADQDRQLAEAFATPERASITTETTGPDGKTAFAIRNAGPETERERLLATAPPPMRPQLMAQWAAQDAAAAKQTEIERHNKATETGGAATVTEEGIDIAARNYLKTGVMPPLGMGDKTTRQRIINRSAELGGADADIASNKAIFGSDSASLKKLQGQRDAVGAFEGTALKNLDVFLDAAKQIPDTKSPVLNKPIRSIDEKVLGSPELTAYNVARTTVIPEFAKILSNPGLSGQLTDSARHEIENVLSGDATLAQTLAAVNVLKKDAENRRTEFDRQIEEVKGRMKGGGKSGAPNAAALREKYKY